MTPGGLSSEDIKFPVMCHYKIIAEDLVGVKEAIEKVFLEVNIEAEVTRGRESEMGKYIAFNADVLIHSLKLMRYIDKGLKGIKGVKVVL